uniref:SOAR domain-containing protein n=1 Tax=Schistocephalus solidus TaxID=70667 RepID=A0A183TKD0_SCHSO
LNSWFYKSSLSRHFQYISPPPLNYLQPISSSGLIWRKSALRNAATTVTPSRPNLSGGGGGGGGAGTGGIFFHLPQAEDETAILSPPPQDWEDGSYKQQQFSPLSPSSSLTDPTAAATGSWTNSLRSRRHAGLRDSASTKSVNAALNNNELYLWLQLTHELELRSYWEKRAAAARQLLAAKEACDRVRRKRNSLMGSIRLVHSDNLDDVDCKLNAARQVLENVSDDLQERTIRWSRIEELTGMRLQEPVDMQWLITHLSIIDESLPLNFIAGRSSVGASERSIIVPPLEFPDFSDGHSDWSGSLSSKLPVDLRLIEKRLQPSSYRKTSLQQEPGYVGKYRSGDTSGRSSPDAVEFPIPPARIPRNYSFVRPFATFWRRKTRSKYPSHGPPLVAPCSTPVGVTTAPCTSASAVAAAGGGALITVSPSTSSDSYHRGISSDPAKCERP